MAFFISKKHLSRRAVLRGAGTTLALPFLEAMVPACTAVAQTAANSNARLACIYFPHGATMSKWTPTTVGKEFEFSEILKPLEGLRKHINVVTNLGHPLAYGPGGASGNHNRSSAAFLSGAKAQAGATAHLGTTMDQVAAQHIGQDTPLPSLELTIEDVSLNCGGGLSCAYRNTLSWQNPTSPLPTQNNPQLVFEQLFGDGSTKAQRQARRQQSLSLLDSVLEQMTSLNKNLSNSDQQRLDSFVTDIREIERRISQAGTRFNDDIEIPSKPEGIPNDVEAHIKLMYDLQVLALQSELTRISTFLMARELSGTVYPGSGIRDSFHTLSHHSNNEENKARFAVLNRYHVSLLAYFLNKLKSIDDGDGSLLDHSMVLYGSGMSDGNSHDHDPLPIVLAGGASGRLEGNRHIKAPEKTEMSNLLLAMLAKLGVELDSFGDSTGKLTI